jgi:hypothetical protein
MLHLPAILILYGMVQLVHVLCTYYDHQNMNDHHRHQDVITKRISRLEGASGFKMTLENELERDLEHMVEEVV